MKYRITKRIQILYGTDKPEKRYSYTIQQRIVTVMCLWIPIWLDMNFDNYPDSKMTFSKLKDAQEYLKDLKNLT